MTTDILTLVLSEQYYKVQKRTIQAALVRDSIIKFSGVIFSWVLS